MYGVIGALDYRLRQIEKCLGQSNNALAITPVINLICNDTTSRDTVHGVYGNWIEYMRFIARKIDRPSFLELFQAADQYIFTNFFKDSSYEIVPTKKEDLEEQQDEKNREWFQHRVDVTEKRIYVFYDVRAIVQRAGQCTSYDYATNQSLIAGVDTSSIPVDTEMRPARDRRQRLMGAHRILYNTVIDTATLATLKESVNDAGKEPLLGVCLMIIHGMLHMKCAVNFDDQCLDHSSRRFVTEVIRHVPPALYGHPLLPVMTYREEEV